MQRQKMVLARRRFEVRLVLEQESLRGDDALVDEYEKLAPVFVAEYLNVLGVDGLALLVNVRRGFDPDHPQLLCNRTEFPIRARISVHVGLDDGLQRGLNRFNGFDAPTHHVVVPALADPGVGCIEAEYEPPISELCGDFWSSGHYCQGAIEHRVLHVRWPVRIFLDVVLRKAHHPGELRRQIDHRRQLMKSVKMSGPRGLRTIHAARGSHNVGPLHTLEPGKETWI
mmetsp:Transcript_31601/g.81701  ORF Transcript_31601/g.81701 Transcript_31601/m.81701 type:complete len:227 (-) Transcript_31601:68-748(-)